MKTNSAFRNKSSYAIDVLKKCSLYFGILKMFSARFMSIRIDYWDIISSDPWLIDE